jgi:uncharacterized protein (DUF1697 family)
MEDIISSHLEKVFGFKIPTLVVTSDDIQNLKAENPFSSISVTKDIRLYLSFLKEVPGEVLILPWSSEDGAFRIIAIINKVICSILDLSITGTIEAMAKLEKTYGKDLTTRNWNTLIRIADKIN